jgi:hypothetical protein
MKDDLKKSIKDGRQPQKKRKTTFKKNEKWKTTTKNLKHNFKNQLTWL